MSIMRRQLYVHGIVSYLLLSVEGLNVLYANRIPGEATVQMFRLSLRSCVRKCKCRDGCTYANYYRLLHRCQLFDGNINNNYEAAPDAVVVAMASVSIKAVFADRQDCSLDNTKICLDIVTDQTTNFLGNMNTAGSKRVITCNRGYAVDGLTTTTCTDKRVWSGHGTCTKVTTMRDPCQSNNDCIDAESECRNSQCWCKPTLSFDPASHACVAFCPGKYGNTFQFLQYHTILGLNRLNTGVADVKECMNLCINYIAQGYTCKYVDYKIDPPRCKFNEIPENQSPPIASYANHWFLQRDCAMTV